MSETWSEDQKFSWTAGGSIPNPPAALSARILELVRFPAAPSSSRVRHNLPVKMDIYGAEGRGSGRAAYGVKCVMRSRYVTEKRAEKYN